MYSQDNCILFFLKEYKFNKHAIVLIKWLYYLLITGHENKIDKMKEQNKELFQILFSYIFKTIKYKQKLNKILVVYIYIFFFFLKSINIAIQINIKRIFKINVYI